MNNRSIDGEVSIFYIGRQVVEGSRKRFVNAGGNRLRIGGCK